MTTRITKTWFDGEKVVMKEIPEWEVYKQEPVAWVCYGVGEKHDLDYQQEDVDALPIGTMLYAAAPRQWVKLTDEEIKEIIGPWGETPIRGHTRKLFDEIEAKLKEKNR